MNLTITITDCGGCCSCRGRVGDILESVNADINLCAPYSIVSGVNGVFNDVTWQAGTQDWRKVVGVITDGVEEFDATQIISCANGCETWQSGIFATIDSILTKIYDGPFFGANCEVPDEFGDPIPNLNATCGDIPAMIGAEGTVTLSTP